MAVSGTILKIKRSSGVASPSSLATGELAYTYGAGSQSNLGDRLFIGTGTETGGVAANIDVIGGKYFTDLLGQQHGVLTADKAIIVDSNSAIDTLKIGNSQTIGGTIYLNEGTNNGSSYVALKSPNNLSGSYTLTLPANAGEIGQFLKVDGSGNLSFDTVVSNFTISNGTNTDTFNTGETLSFLAGTGIDIAITDNAVQISGKDASTSAKGVASFSSNNFAATSGNITIKSGGVGTTELAPDAVTEEKITNSAVTTDKINDLAVTTGKLSDSAVTTAKINDLAVTTGKITNSAVTTDKINDLAVTTGKITNSAVTTDKINDLAVTTGKINDLAVTTGKLADKSVTTGKIDDNAVTETQIASDAVTTVKIKDGNVTNAKLQYSKTTLGTTDLTLGSTALELAGLQKLTVDNIEINNNSITAKNENGNIDLVPNGNGTVDVSSKRITSVANPEQSTDAANKAYVDSATQGLHVHSPVIAATTDTLTNITGGTVSYDNGTLGVGAFITLQNPLTELDTIHLTALDRILVKNETNQAYNGIYTYTNSTTLTRATDSDQAFEFAGGDFLFVTSGQINGNNGYVQTQKVTTMGSDAIIFEQFSGAGQIVAGAGLTKTGNQLDVQVDNSTIEIVADTLQVKDSGITANQLATDSVTTAKIKDGDVTNAKLANSKITIIASDASTDDISLGETLTITNGEAIVSSISSNTLSFTARKATSSLTGVAYFPTANFTVTDGSVAISTIDGGTF